jgi:hypothetical protein
MIDIPTQFAKGTLHLFVAGYTGIEFARIVGIEIEDNLLCVDVGSYFSDDISIDDYNVDFFVKRQDWDGVCMYFEFPLNGWDYLGKGTSFFNDGKRLYEDTMERCGTDGSGPIFPGDMK